MSLRYGYVSNGLSDHRLEDALALLAENGYDGVALTLDHIHFDPFAPRPARAAARLRAELEALGLDCVVETGARFVLDPRRKHFPTLLSARPAAPGRPPVHARWTSPSSSGHRSSRCGQAPRPPASRRERAWDLLRRRLRAGARARRAPRLTLAFEPEPGHARRDTRRLRGAAAAAREPARRSG